MTGSTRETQRSISEWAAATFPGADPLRPRLALRALEECIELCLEAGSSADEIGKSVDKATCKTPWIDLDDDESIHRSAKIPAEAADVLITLYVLAGAFGFDLHAEVDRKMSVNRSRCWRASGDGTGYHVPSGKLDDGDGPMP